MSIVTHGVAWVRRERAAVATFLLVFAVYLIPLGRTGEWWNPNEMSRVALSVSLVEYGTIQLDHVLDDYDQVPQDLSVRDGHAYSDKAPGMSFLGAGALLVTNGLFERVGASQSPDYWPLRHFLTALLVSLPAALFVVFAARQMPMAGDALRPDWPAYAVLFAFATPWLTYASVLFSHEAAGILVAVALLLARRLDNLDPSVVEYRAALIGLLASFAVVTEYPTVLLAALVPIAVWRVERRKQVVPAFVAGGLVGVAVLLVYNKAAWGSFFATGYAFKAFAEHAAVHAQGFAGVRLPTLEGLWGVLLSPSRGLLFYSPLLICIPIGLALHVRSARPGTRLTIAALLAYIAFAAGFVDWQGGWSAAARHLVPVLPLLFEPFSDGLRWLLQRGAYRAMAAVLVGVSVGTSILSVAVTPFFPESFTNPLGQLVVPTLLDGVAMRNLITDLTGMHAFPVFVVFALFVAASAIVVLVRLLPPTRRWPFAVIAIAAMLLFPAAVFLAGDRSAGLEQQRVELLARLGF